MSALEWVAVMPKMDDSTALSEAIHDAVADGEGGITEWGLQRIYAAVLEHYAVPHQPASLGEISQAQAVREALARVIDPSGFDQNPANEAWAASRRQSAYDKARKYLAALFASPLPAQSQEPTP